MGRGESKMALIKVTYVCPDCKEFAYSQVEKQDGIVENQKTDDVLCDSCNEADAEAINSFYQGF